MSSTSGYACPKCGNELERREGGFALRLHGSFPGLYCMTCMSIRSDPDNSFDEAAGLTQAELPRI